jgi:hypothetical protein
MMKYFFAVILSTLTSSLFAQGSDSTFISRNNELRISMLNVLIESVDIQYERLLSQTSGLGVTVGIGYKSEDSPLNTIFKVTPAYRYYFGERKAAGFFIEGQVRFSCDRGERGGWRHEVNDHGFYYQNEFNLGLAASAGGKLATKNGFVGIIKGGVGRFVTQKNSFFSELYPIFELALGKRF